MRLAGRVRGLALTHDLIADDDWRGVTLDDLAARQLAPFFGEEGFTRVVCEGPRVLLSPRVHRTWGLPCMNSQPTPSSTGHSLIPAILRFDLQYPRVRAQGRDAPSFGDEAVPGVAGGLGDGVVVGMQPV